ncbi:hypothetical protein M758_2G071500 [Ceratodon purpureus]|uniref:Uncharacterized protein n=1 Tax=Ceratodon purpureus TaxID=3225 RepID=A0A8T0IS74_CERPU|nr:hypothetical protein KC19_2G100800 [Ceratodon purpureus]KAG0625657.1 hypothetical protein M758_2G071500 [Ceratodon purpureus]
MGAIETSILVVVALILGWGAVEIACKPCMESGRSAINRSLDPDYDPDDEIANTPYVEAPARPVEKEEEPAFPESPKKSYKVVKGEPSDI